MNKIKLSKSVQLSNNVNGKYVDLYQKILDECIENFRYFIDVNVNNENILKIVPNSNISQIELNLKQLCVGYIQIGKIEKESISARGNKKIDLTLSKVELVRVDTSFENCIFILHFITEDLYIRTFAGNSVIVSPLNDGLHTIMIDFDDKEVAVEYMD